MSVERLLPPWLASLVPYQPGKPVEEVERELGIRDSIKLASNENPLGPSPKAVQAILEAANNAHRYPDGGCYYLKQKLAAKLGVEASRILVTNGSNEILELLARLLLRPGDDAVLSDQAFVVYGSVVQAAAGIARSVPLRDFTHDLDAIGASILSSTRLVFLGNPNNPTGTIFRRSEFERFLNNLRRDVVVVCDEAYFEYVEDPEYPDSLRSQTEGRLLVTVRTFSKAYGLAGLRIGYGIGPESLVAALNRIRQPFNVNSIAQAAALAALDDDEHVRRSRQLNAEGKRFLRDELDRLGVSTVPTEANFLLVRVGEGARVCDALMREGVIVRSMGMYGFPDHVRVTIGTQQENSRFIASLARGLARLAKNPARP